MRQPLDVGDEFGAETAANRDPAKKYERLERLAQRPELFAAELRNSIASQVDAMHEQGCHARRVVSAATHVALYCKRRYIVSHEEIRSKQTRRLRPAHVLVLRYRHPSLRERARAALLLPQLTDLL